METITHEQAIPLLKAGNSLQNQTVAGSLVMEDQDFKNAKALSSIAVEGDLVLKNSIVRGELVLRDLSVLGSLVLEGLTIEGMLAVESLKCDDTVIVEKVDPSGRINLTELYIERDLSFRSTDHTEITLREIEVGGRSILFQALDVSISILQISKLLSHEGLKLDISINGSEITISEAGISEIVKARFARSKSKINILRPKL